MTQASKPLLKVRDSLHVVSASTSSTCKLPLKVHLFYSHSTLTKLSEACHLCYRQLWPLVSLLCNLFLLKEQQNDNFDLENRLFIHVFKTLYRVVILNRKKQLFPPPIVCRALCEACSQCHLSQLLYSWAKKLCLHIFGCFSSDTICWQCYYTRYVHTCIFCSCISA